nr:GYF domain-containing protein [Pseudoxanthomonas sp.]
MAQWYYAEGPGRNVGPLTADEIAARFRQGQIFLDTQVWREGMAQWQPLRGVAAELGLDGGAASSLPPPLPGRPMNAPPRAAYAAAPAPRKMSRGMIILIVCLAAIIPAVAIIGILAAIALPAYHDYTSRAKLMEPIAAGDALKPLVERHLAAGQCPDNETDGFQPEAAYASQHVAGILVGEFDDGTCGVEVRVRGTGNTRMDDHAIWIFYDGQSRQWGCTSDIEDRFLPVRCRG